MASKPYRLKKRGTIYHYKLPSMINFASTGETNRQRAENFAYKKSLGEPTSPQIQQLETRVQIPTLREFAKDFFDPGKCKWLAWRQASNSLPEERYIERCRHYLVDEILPFWGEYRLDAIRRRDVKPWILTVPGGSAKKNHVMNAFKIVLNQAEEDEWIDRNPVSGIGRLHGDEHPPSSLEFSEINLLFPFERVAMLRIWGSFKWAVFFILLIGTGMRQGEARALRWRHVSWKLKALIIESAAKKTRKADPDAMRIGTTKSGKARIVLLSKRTSMALFAYWAFSEHTEPDDLIFPGTYNHKIPLSGEAVSLHFADALKAVGIQANGRRLVPHSLRHTYVSHLRREMGDWAVQTMVGHSSAAITDIYDDAWVVQSAQALEPARACVSALLPAPPPEETDVETD